MEFTENELLLITKARKKAKSTKLIRIAILIAMLLSFGFMFMGFFDSEKLVFCLFISVIVAIAYPQFGEGPKYEELVSMLERKSVK